MDDELLYRKRGLTDADLEAMGDTLAVRHCATRKVDVSFNEKVTDVGIFYLARGLRGNKSVTTLKIDGTGMTDKGLGVIGKALEKNTTLTALSAKGTKITADGMRAFSRSLKFHNDTLRSFDAAPHLPACAALPKATPDTAAARAAKVGARWTSAYFPKPAPKRVRRQQERDPPHHAHGQQYASPPHTAGGAASAWEEPQVEVDGAPIETQGATPGKARVVVDDDDDDGAYTPTTSSTSPTVSEKAPPSSSAMSSHSAVV